MYFFIKEGIKFLIIKWHHFEGHVILVGLILSHRTIAFMWSPFVLHNTRIKCESLFWMTNVTQLCLYIQWQMLFDYVCMSCKEFALVSLEDWKFKEQSFLTRKQLFAFVSLALKCWKRTFFVLTNSLPLSAFFSPLFSLLVFEILVTFVC